MSRHYFYKLFPFIKALTSNAKPNILTFLGSSIAITYIHGTFALATNEIEEICVAKKYKYVSNGFTNFMIVDTNGRHFNVNNSFWYLTIATMGNICIKCKRHKRNTMNYTRFI